MTIFDIVSAPFDVAFEKFKIKDIDDQLQDLEKLFPMDIFEKRWELAIELFVLLRRKISKKHEMVQFVQFYLKIEERYPHIFNSVDEYTTADVYMMCLIIGRLDLADKYQNHMLKHSTIEFLFDIFYIAIYYDHFEKVYENMIGKWRETYSYPQSINSFYHHYYLLQTLLVEKKNYITSDVKTAFEFLEEFENGKSDLRKYRSWILGKKSHPWKDLDFSNKSVNWERNCQLLSYELLHYMLHNERISISLKEAEVFRSIMFYLFKTHSNINQRKGRNKSRFKPKYSQYTNAFKRYSKELHTSNQGVNMLFALKYLPFLIDFLIEKNLLDKEDQEEYNFELNKIIDKFEVWFKFGYKQMLKSEIDKIKHLWKQ